MNPDQAGSRSGSAISLVSISWHTAYTWFPRPHVGGAVGTGTCIFSRHPLRQGRRGEVSPHHMGVIFCSRARILKNNLEFTTSRFCYNSLELSTHGFAYPVETLCKLDFCTMTANADFFPFHQTLCKLDSSYFLKYAKLEILIPWGLAGF